LFAQHKTTLNEAEIQNAVEQAAGLFKKVVLQRRKERKPAEDGESQFNFLFLSHIGSVNKKNMLGLIFIWITRHHLKVEFLV